MAPRRRPALGEQPRLSMAPAVSCCHGGLGATGRVGAEGESDEGREADKAGTSPGGFWQLLQRSLGAGMREGAADAAEGVMAPRGVSTRGRRAGGCTQLALQVPGRKGHRVACELRGDTWEHRGSRKSGGAAGGKGAGQVGPAEETAGVRGGSAGAAGTQHQHDTSGPEQGSAYPQVLGGRGAGAWGGWEGLGHGSTPPCVQACDPRGPEPPRLHGRSMLGMSSPLQEGKEGRVARGACRGPGICVEGPAGGHGCKQQGWRGEEQGDWHVGRVAAGQSSARCCWSQGEAGSWRGTWLSCWKCTGGRQGEAGGQRALGVAGHPQGGAGQGRTTADSPWETPPHS